MRHDTPAASLIPWLHDHGGIAHREELLRVGFPIAGLRAASRTGEVQTIRRAWLALPDAEPDLVLAARAGGRVGCVSAARRHGWWIPESVPALVHVAAAPHAGSTGLRPGEVVTHWTKPLAPAGRHELVSPVEDALAHIAVCLPHDEALIVWESAVRTENLAPEYLRRVPWRSRAAAALAGEVLGLSDSGLEAALVIPLRRLGQRVRQQVVIAGRPVDAVIGEHLVIQTDGFAFHGTGSAQRSADIAHDAELRLRGYTVLRFSYAQVVHDWPTVAAIVRRAVAAGLAR